MGELIHHCSATARGRETGNLTAPARGETADALSALHNAPLNFSALKQPFSLAINKSFPKAQYTV